MMFRLRTLWIATGIALAAAAVPTLHGALSRTADTVAGDNDHGHHHDRPGDRPTAGMTVWTDRFELFIEHPYVVLGEPTIFVVHVTDRLTHLPRSEGPVRFILGYGSAEETVHVEPAPARPGIYTPILTFSSAAQGRAAVAIPTADDEHEIELPAIRIYASVEEAAHAPEMPEIQGITYLKEQQWRRPVQIQAVAAGRLEDREVLTVPESAVIDPAGKPTVVVQVAGELFQQRRVELGIEADHRLEVRSGLRAGEQVVTAGAEDILRPKDATDAEHAHAEESGGDGHDHGDLAVEAAEHEHGAEDIHLAEGGLERFGIEVAAAKPGSIHKTVTLTGEIKLNQDRLAQVVPRMPGIVRRIDKSLGDPVEPGEVLATIESRTLADAKAEYLAARERRNLAAAVFEREERLRRQEISSEQEYLDAQQALVECEVLMQAAEQGLLAMGLSEQYLRQLPEGSRQGLTALDIRAPVGGIVIEKDIVLGGHVCDENPVFVIADLATVWLDLDVHERHLAELEIGQRVTLEVRGKAVKAQGTIDYIHPIIAAETRTVLARAVMPNPAGKLRPGAFVTATVATEPLDSGVVVARDAVQYLEDEPVVFVYAAGDFTTRHVTLGRSDDEFVEVVSGVHAGEMVAVAGSFRLKAEIEKRSAGDVGHGHAH